MISREDCIEHARSIGTIAARSSSSEQQTVLQILRALRTTTIQDKIRTEAVAAGLLAWRTERAAA